MDHDAIVQATRQWISSIVIDLNLCPFARRVFDANLVRYVVSEATDEVALLADLSDELKKLAATPISEIETTLLIHPHAFQDFLEYNDFLTPAEELLCNLRLDGVIQIASFHPQYQFAGSEPDAVENYTNRSPYPMLHLLREESITALNLAEDELLEIPQRNIETLHRLGLAKVLERLKRA